VVSGAGWPARYEVRLAGVLDDHWSEWLGGLLLTREGDQTVLSGMLQDQPALHGILDKLGDLGLTVISVRRLPAQQPGGEPR
jgi:hypothetical protein